MSNQFDDLRQFARDHGMAEEGDPIIVKPNVLLPGGRVRILDTARALFGILADKKVWFCRGGAVVILEKDPGQILPVVHVLKPAKARSEFEEYADLFVQNKDGPVPGVMSEDTAKAILESSMAKQTLPNLSGLINCPLAILRNGEFHILPAGYDARTGYYVTGPAATEPASLEQAVAIITGIIAEYSFQTPGDISRAIASILTPMLKFGGFIKGFVPIEVVEANDSQTGKGYFVLIRCAVYGEQPTYVAAKKGGVGSLDESFASALVKGRPFIVFDNFRGNLDSQYLESLLTAQGQFSVRIPHAGEMYIDPSRYLVSITSNGMQTTRDMAKRSSFIRLEKQNNHHFHRFNDNDDLLVTIRKHQPMFLGAVLAVIRQWHQLGMPRTNENRHSFVDWAQINDWIVQNLFDEAPLLDGHADAQNRVQDSALTFARLLAIEVNNRDQLGTRLSATEIFDICENGEISIPGLGEKQSDNQDFGKKLIGKIMNKLFGNNNHFAMESFIITRESEKVVTLAGNTQEQKKYTFTQAEKQKPAEGA